MYNKIIYKLSFALLRAKSKQIGVSVAVSNINIIDADTVTVWKITLHFSILKQSKTKRTMYRA